MLPTAFQADGPVDTGPSAFHRVYDHLLEALLACVDLLADGRDVISLPRVKIRHLVPELLKLLRGGQERGSSIEPGVVLIVGVPDSKANPSTAETWMVRLCGPEMAARNERPTAAVRASRLWNSLWNASEVETAS